jgi:hypothetical protein
VHDQDAIVDKAHPIQILNRITVRSDPRRIPLPHLLERRAARAGSVFEEFNLGGRFAEVNT